MHRLWVGTWVGAFLCSSCITGNVVKAPSAAQAIAFPADDDVLPSGLRVVAEQSPDYGSVCAVLHLSSGSADESPEQAGLAHLVEHLVFRSRRSELSYKQRLEQLGVSDANAFTSPDSTTFFAVVPKQELAALAELMADVLADPLHDVSDADFSHELDIVRNELHTRTESGTPGQGLGWLYGAVFGGTHAYGHGPVGSEQTLASLTLADARAFAAKHYRPERATLVLNTTAHTSVPLQLARELATARFQQPAVPARRTEQPTLPTTEARLALHEAAVASPTLWIGWSVPNEFGSDAGIAALLKSMSGAHFWSEAWPDRDIGNIEPGYIPGARAGLFYLKLELKQATSPESTAQATIGEMRHGLSNLAFSSGFESLKRHVATQATYAQESLPVRSLDLAVSASFTRDPQFLRRVTDRMIARPASEVVDYYSKYLSDERARMVLVRPGRGGFSLRPSSEPGGGSDSGQRPPAADEATVRSWMTPPGTAAAESRTLENGLTVLALRKPGSPFHTAILGFHGGSIANVSPGARVAALWARQQYSLPPSVWGVLHRTESSEDSSFEMLRSTGDNVEFTLHQVNESLGFSVLWPVRQFTNRLEVFRREENQPAERLQNASRDALFGNNPLGAHVTADALSKLSAREVHDYIDSVRIPENSLLVVVGDIEPQAALSAAAKEFSSWHTLPNAQRAPVKPPEALRSAAASPNQRFLVQNLPGAAQAALHFACVLPEARESTLGHYWLFDSVAEGVLYGHLREQARASYSVNNSWRSFRGGTTLFEFRADVDPARLDQAFATVRRFLRASPSELFSPELLSSARNHVARTFNATYDTSADLARAMLGAWNSGFNVTVLDKIPAQVFDGGPEALAPIAASCQANWVLAVLGDEGRIQSAWARSGQ
ncbi:MAG: insulinase family protein [Polyangiaceae bacterium]